MQQVLAYLSYFFYISLHFNPLLAIAVLADDIRGERKYRLHTTGVKEVYKLKIEGLDTANSFEYMPSNYVLLERVFTHLNTYPHNKTFVDMGCGKGRSLWVAAHYGFQKITGVELLPAYCRLLQKEVNEKSLQFPSVSFSISCMDASLYPIPDDVEVFFFYNPFNEVVMKKVVRHIVKSISAARRPVYIIYLNPIYKALFVKVGFEEIYHTSRFGYLTASILHVTPTAVAATLTEIK